MPKKAAHTPRNAAIQQINHHLTAKGYIQRAIVRKLLQPYFSISKSHLYVILKMPSDAAAAFTVAERKAAESLYTFGIAVAADVLKPFDLKR
jgi:hypothetical protein